MRFFYERAESAENAKSAHDQLNLSQSCGVLTPLAQLAIRSRIKFDKPSTNATNKIMATSTVPVS